MAHVLDNPVWHSLSGPRRAHGTVLEQAGRFDPEVSLFAAVSDEAAPSAWAELETLVASGEHILLFRDPIEPPREWKVEMRLAGLQMVASRLNEAGAVEDPRLVELGPADAPEMLALATETQPGPFFVRTVELGGYLGVRDGGRLVAMAGERMRCTGYTEISAVCTTPDQRGKGLATALVLALVQRIRERGEEAFLHAELTNTNAIRLYESLGFEARRELEGSVVRAPIH